MRRFQIATANLCILSLRLSRMREKERESKRENETGICTSHVYVCVFTDCTRNHTTEMISEGKK